MRVRGKCGHAYPGSFAETGARMRIEAGQVAVVTGAGSGLGRALAQELAGRGVQVVLADLDVQGLETTAAAVESAGTRAIVEQVDVTDAVALTALAERSLAATGRMDLVINNAGITPTDPAPMWELDLAEWHRVLEVNLFGVVHGIRAFTPHLVAAGCGHVVNIASLAGLINTPWSSAYGISKHGVVAASETLRAELDIAGSPVGVTAVCPGFVRTPMVARMREQLDEPVWRERMGEQVRQAALQSLNDALEPEEAARRVLAAVEADHLYALPNGDAHGGARTRAERILQALDSQQ